MPKVTKMLFDEPGLGILSLPSEPEGLVGGVAWELFIRICEGEEIFGEVPALARSLSCKFCQPSQSLKTCPEVW